MLIQEGKEITYIGMENIYKRVQYNYRKIKIVFVNIKE